MDSDLDISANLFNQESRISWSCVISALISSKAFWTSSVPSGILYFLFFDVNGKTVTVPLPGESCFVKTIPK